MSVPVEKRPKFKTCWINAVRIYSSSARSNDELLQFIAKAIGGKVFANICKEFSGKVCTIPTYTERLNPPFNAKWANTCAVRLSYILNYSGFLIPKIADKTVSGSDKFQYFHLVVDLVNWLEQAWGKPEVEIEHPVAYEEIKDAAGNVVRNADGSAKLSGYGGKLAGRQGILLFSPIKGWENAAGHASLFDGKSKNNEYCYDHCYFNPDPGNVYHTAKARFWDLP